MTNLKFYLTVSIIVASLNKLSAQASYEEVYAEATTMCIELRDNPELFCDYASQYSSDVFSKDSCGLYDWTPKENYLPVIVTALDSLSELDISNPIKSSYGIMIIQKLGARNNMVKYRMIMLDYDAGPESNFSEGSIDFAKSLSKELRQHPDKFCEKAELFSYDENSANNCGLYDWTPKSNFDKEVIDKIESMEDSEISHPIYTESGILIIQRIGVKDNEISFRVIIIL